MKKYIMSFIFLMQCIQANHHFVLIIASYNNEKWCEKNIDSVLSQKYDNFDIIYIDDCSSDKTYELVSNRINYWNAWDRVTLIRNDRRMLAMANHYYAINKCLSTDIIVIVDGDDALANDTVLAYLNEIYSNLDTWVTYGQFKSFPFGNAGCAEISPDIFKRNACRKEAWWPHFPSHLRTFYAGLAQKIKKNDLMWKGDFLPMNCDVALMFPMLEMAHKGHVKFISTILYEYNMANVINDHKVDGQLQHKTHMYLRNLPPYEAVDKPY